MFTAFLLQESSANIDARKGEEVTRDWIICVVTWFSKVSLNSWKSVFEKVLAGLLQMELVSSANSRRQARWAFIVTRNLDSYLRCLRVAPIFVYLHLSLFGDRVSANDAMMSNDHQSKLASDQKENIGRDECDPEGGDQPRWVCWDCLEVRGFLSLRWFKTFSLFMELMDLL